MRHDCFARVSGIEDRIINMSNVTAVVLTIGEETTQRAIDSVEHQTVLPEEITVIRDVVPFHKALNLGASKVKTDFFIQVDSDMVLDRNCLEDLRKCMGETVGIAVGQLRDSIIKKVVGIKIFRRECFEKVQFKDSISPDTDFYDDIVGYGWNRAVALKFEGKGKELWHTFGEHRPEYTPLYTYSKFLLYGGRCRYRKSPGGVRLHFQQLQQSKHDASWIAQIAMAHGVFLEVEKDSLKPYSESEDFILLHEFVKSENSWDVVDDDISALSVLAPRAVFEKYYKLGIDLRRHGAFPVLKHYLDVLSGTEDISVFIARVALCHGLFFNEYNVTEFKISFNLLEEFL